MTSEQFTYWLQGYLEVADPKTLNEKQVQIIKDHLALVFKKVTPDYTRPSEIINTPFIDHGRTSAPIVPLTPYNPEPPYWDTTVYC